MRRWDHMAYEHDRTSITARRKHPATRNRTRDHLIAACSTVRCSANWAIAGIAWQEMQNVCHVRLYIGCHIYVVYSKSKCWRGDCSVSRRPLTPILRSGIRITIHSPSCSSNTTPLLNYIMMRGPLGDDVHAIVLRDSLFIMFDDVENVGRLSYRFVSEPNRLESIESTIRVRIQVSSGATSAHSESSRANSDAVVNAAGACAPGRHEDTYRIRC